LRLYADTSFLVSLYSPDVHSTQAAVQMSRLRGRLLLTPLGELELTNALELRIFRKEANEMEIRRAQAEFEEHARSGVFELEGAPATVYERARHIARKRTAIVGVRTLDILHVASALLLGADRFWTFDQRQSELAKAEGMRTT
jgi:predicted nucleic acid-binding protein